MYGLYLGSEVEYSQSGGLAAVAPSVYADYGCCRIGAHGCQTDDDGRLGGWSAGEIEGCQHDTHHRRRQAYAHRAGVGDHHPQLLCRRDGHGHLYARERVIGCPQGIKRQIGVYAAEGHGASPVAEGEAGVEPCLGAGAERSGADQCRQDETPCHNQHDDGGSL